MGGGSHGEVSWQLCCLVAGEASKRKRTMMMMMMKRMQEVSIFVADGPHVHLYYSPPSHSFLRAHSLESEMGAFDCLPHRPEFLRPLCSEAHLSSSVRVMDPHDSEDSELGSQSHI